MSTSPFQGPKWFLIQWGVVLLLLAACTPVGPDYQAPQSPLPGRWQNGQGVLPHAGVQDLEQWWQLFEDPQLNILIHEAISANADLAIAETRIREARALSRVVDADLLPTVDLDSAYTNTRKSDHISSGGTRQDLFALNFDAAWELDFFGGNQRRSEAATATLAATVEDYRDVLVSLSAEVAKNYIDLRAAQERERIARQNIQLQEQTLHLTQERYTTGLGNALEVAQAQTQLALLQAQLSPLLTLAAKSAHQLAFLLAKQPQSPSWLSMAALPQPPPRLPAILPSELLRQRPDIRSSERQLAFASAEVGVATADLFPRFSLAALIGVQSTDLQQLVTSGSRYWTLGPTIQWTLFDGGRRRASLEAGQARLDRARLSYEKTVLNALKEVEDALVNLDREQNTKSRLDEAVRSSRHATELSQYQYKAGLNTFLNVLLAQATLAQTEDKLVQSNQSLSLAMIALYKAMGGGWHNATTPRPFKHTSPPSPSRLSTRTHE
ncbi:MAG: efflux transporter outer membrane subunit [Desulfobulbus sp.]|nr:efflux transporter outer membrane subunit [Desulfobulbus sp.]